MTPNMINGTNNIKIKQIIVSGLHYKLELNLSVYQKTMGELEKNLYFCDVLWVIWVFLVYFEFLINLLSFQNNFS